MPQAAPVTMTEPLPKKFPRQQKACSDQKKSCDRVSKLGEAALLAHILR